MREALALAARARGRTAPNPVVGAVIVRGGRRVSGGYHARVGGLHGEASAIRNARESLRGATLYCTLEPCSHHGRQPPCVDAVLEADFRRVVVGMRDPDPRTAGRSIARLRRAGVEVVVGVEAEACRELNRGFLSRIERRRPYTLLKLAASLDGRIATASGESRWITGPAARGLVQRWRAGVDAVAVGSGTARADDPELVARRAGRVVHRPRRVVVDSKLRLGPEARLLDAARPGSAILLTSTAASRRKKRELEQAGAQLVEVARRGSHLDLRAGWRALARCGVNEVLVEGGGGLGAALIRADLVDRLYLFLAPMLIGGDGRAVLGELGVSRLREARRPEVVELRRVGADLLLTARW
jgi:diaminohydroxyphosphoribosylaminopyrimidine deaminase/5-amino-6-(5-phosphoribosylamino)uracil reductase